MLKFARAVMYKFNIIEYVRINHAVIFISQPDAIIVVIILYFRLISRLFQHFNMKLNPMQLMVYQKAINASSQKNNVFFVNGAAGTGKTFLLNAILDYCQNNHIPFAAIAYNGSAACDLLDGKTVHSCFQFPWNPMNVSSGLSSESDEYKEIKNAKIIVWDQATTSNRLIIEEVDRFLCKMMNNKHIFGGKIVIMCGDYFDCLPIVGKGRNDNDAERDSLIMFSENLWPHFQVFSLTQNQRFVKPNDYYQWCKNIGSGNLDVVALPPDCRVNNLESLVYFVYTDSNEANRCILTLYNDTVEAVNNNCLKQLYNDQTTPYKSINFFRKLNRKMRSSFYEMNKFIERLPKNFPLNELQMAVNCPVMLMRAYKGVQAGTRLIIKKLGKNFVIGKIVCGRQQGRLLKIRKVAFVLTMEQSNLKFVQVQIPVKLNFAMTINKAQGLEFDKLGLYFHAPPFKHGQLYVALSRVKNNQTDLKILVDEPKNGNFSYNQMPNIVIKSIYDQHF